MDRKKEIYNGSKSIIVIIEDDDVSKFLFSWTRAARAAPHTARCFALLRFWYQKPEAV